MTQSCEAYHEGVKIFKTSVNHIKQQIAELKQDVCLYQYEIDQHKKKIEILKNEKSKLITNLKNATLDFENMHAVNNETIECLKQAQQENCISCETICQLEAQMKKKEEENFDLNKQLDVYEYEMKHLESEYHECYKKLSNVKTIEDAHALTVKENQNLLDKIQKTETEFKNQSLELQVSQEKIATLQEQNKKSDEKIKEMVDAQEILNKSIGDLENCNGVKAEKIKEVEEKGHLKIHSLEKLTSKLQIHTRKLEQDLEMIRCELNERRKQVSELKHENLERDFKLQDVERCLKEKEALLKSRETDASDMQSRYETLSNELSNLKEKLKYLEKQKESKKRDENESMNVLKLMADMKIKRGEKSLNDDQQSMIQQQEAKIAELERKLKDEESTSRAEKLEKSYLKEELERIRVRNVNRLKDKKNCN